MAKYTYGKKMKIKLSPREVAALANYTPPIPDRVGDQYQQRGAQKQAALRAQQRARQRYAANPERYGQDGGISPQGSYDRSGDARPIPTRRRGARKSGWRRGSRYNPQRRGNAIPGEVAGNSGYRY